MSSPNTARKLSREVDRMMQEEKVDHMTYDVDDDAIIMMSTDESFLTAVLEMEMRQKKEDRDARKVLTSQHKELTTLTKTLESQIETFKAASKIEKDLLTLQIQNSKGHLEDARAELSRLQKAVSYL